MYNLKYTKYSSNLYTDISRLYTKRLKLYLITTCVQCTFLNIKPKMCLNISIDEDCLIFDSVIKCKIFKVYLKYLQ